MDIKNKIGSNRVSAQSRNFENSLNSDFVFCKKKKHVISFCESVFWFCVFALKVKFLKILNSHFFYAQHTQNSETHHLSIMDSNENNKSIPPGLPPIDAVVSFCGTTKWHSTWSRNKRLGTERCFKCSIGSCSSNNNSPSRSTCWDVGGSISHRSKSCCSTGPR